jgi:hypothetical protein
MYGGGQDLSGYRGSVWCEKGYKHPGFIKLAEFRRMTDSQLLNKECPMQLVNTFISIHSSQKYLA